MRSFAGRDICPSRISSTTSSCTSSRSPDGSNRSPGRRNSDLLKDKILVTAFYQPSTRTRLAHEAPCIGSAGTSTVSQTPR